ncbi:MAG: SDR family oxidoreductase [Planctomycetes bacterium]|nr:SDR family oxidoreductase [Planctomycetota bacterium]
MSTARPVAVVTGAGRRVGRAVAVELARNGFDLALTYHRSEAEASKTVSLAIAAAEDSATSIDCQRFRVDLNVPDEVEQLGRTLRALPRIDAVVHNASSYGSSPFGSITAEHALDHYRVNALAPLLLTQALNEQLSRSPLPGGGAVVCFSDIHVLGRPLKNFAAYAMAKAAMTQMVHSLARDMAPAVRVNAIAPGVIAWPDDTDPDEVAAYERRIPLGRPGTPQDAAAVVRWLILEAVYITGEVLRLDGGRWLA